MKRSALPSRLEDWAAGVARRRENRPVLRRTYESVVALEIAAARSAAHRRRVPPAEPGNVTLAVKTFERPDVLRRMLASVRRVYSGPIVIADDSLTPFTTDDPAVRVLALPFDSGVGAGRNALIDAVTTEYLWMADDDMILLPDFDLLRVVRYLEAHPEVDLCGGRVINLPLWESADYLASPLFAHRGQPRRPQGTLIGGLPVHLKVPNFYVARTERLASVRYDDALRRVDHTDFFTSAHGTLLCVCDQAMACLHARSYFDPHYLSFREDTAADLAHLARKWPAQHGERHTDAQHLYTAVRVAFHHAAVQVVADDLRVRVVHAGGPGDAVATVAAPPPDLERLHAALVSLGWTRTGKGLAHPLWGRLLTTADPLPGAVRVAFAHVAGMAVDGAAWPAPLAHEEPPADARRWVRWSARAGWVDTGEEVFGAPLPLGPVVTLVSPGDLVWEIVGRVGAELEDVVSEVTGTFSVVPDGAAQQVRDYVAGLVARGLLEFVTS